MSQLKIMRPILIFLVAPMHGSAILSTILSQLLTYLHKVDIKAKGHVRLGSGAVRSQKVFATHALELTRKELHRKIRTIALKQQT